MEHKRHLGILNKGVFLSLLLYIVVTACQPVTAPSTLPVVTDAPTSDSLYVDKRIAWVDSYHQGYEWSDGVEQGVRTVLDDTGVDLQVFRLDTKNNTDEAWRQTQAQKIHADIMAFAPDVVIACDDNAQTYLIVPYFKDTNIPVVFCGLNWDAGVYGYPTGNITGMIEVELIEQIVAHLSKYNCNTHIGYLAVDSNTERKITSIYQERFFNNTLTTYFFTTWSEFKSAFINIQEEVDLLIIGTHAGIDQWDDATAAEFMLKNTRIPTASSYTWLAPSTLLILSKQPQEQGEWAAQAALRILNGTPVSDIPIVENQKGELYLNLDIAEQLDIVFTPSMLKNAHIYGMED